MYIYIYMCVCVLQCYSRLFTFRNYMRLLIGTQTSRQATRSRGLDMSGHLGDLQRATAMISPLTMIAPSQCS